MNKINLHKYASGQYALEINSQVCKTDYTSSTYEGVIIETNAFLVGTKDVYGYNMGVPMLSGTWQDNMDLTINYTIPDPTPLNFDSTNNYLIKFINHS